MQKYVKKYLKDKFYKKKNSEKKFQAIFHQKNQRKNFFKMGFNEKQIRKKKTFSKKNFQTIFNEEEIKKKFKESILCKIHVKKI